MCHVEKETRPEIASAKCLFCPRTMWHRWIRAGQEKPLQLKQLQGFQSQSGRPDLNRGPPAPKAGAIPGYATPRGSRKLLYPALGAQRT